MVSEVRTELHDASIIQHPVGYVNNTMLRDSPAPPAEDGSVRKSKKSNPLAPAARAVFAERLKAARLMAGFETQDECAKKLGIEPERYRRWERAETEPDVTLLGLLADTLKISLDFLIPGKLGLQGRTRTASV